MTPIRFIKARDAKEFLVASIVNEARREGVSLAEVERKMLYFSEAGWAPPRTVNASHEFDQKYDQAEYERKIARLIRNARDHARKEGKQAFDTWSDAIAILSKEDHYLLVMIRQAGAAGRPHGDLLRLWVTAIAIVLGSPCLFDTAARLGIQPTRESQAVLVWAVAACITGVYYLFRAFAGRERAEELLNTK